MICECAAMSTKCMLLRLIVQMMRLPAMALALEALVQAQLRLEAMASPTVQQMGLPVVTMVAVHSSIGIACWGVRARGSVWRWCIGIRLEQSSTV